MLRVIGDDGVVTEPGGQQVRIDGRRRRLDAARYRSVETAAHPHQATGGDVVSEQIVGSVRAGPLAQRTRSDELLM